VPLAATVTVTLCPADTDRSCGWLVIVGAVPDGGVGPDGSGGAGDVTVTVAVAESVWPPSFETRSQYCVVEVSGGVV
jgi:hypothetical protein